MTFPLNWSLFSLLMVSFVLFRSWTSPVKATGCPLSSVCGAMFSTIESGFSADCVDTDSSDGVSTGVSPETVFSGTVSAETSSGFSFSDFTSSGAAFSDSVSPGAGSSRTVSSVFGSSCAGFSGVVSSAGASAATGSSASLFCNATDSASSAAISCTASSVSGLSVVSTFCSTAASLSVSSARAVTPVFPSVPSIISAARPIAVIFFFRSFLPICIPLYFITDHYFFYLFLLSVTFSSCTRTLFLLHCSQIKTYLFVTENSLNSDDYIVHANFSVYTVPYSVRKIITSARMVDLWHKRSKGGFFGAFCDC